MFSLGWDTTQVLKGTSIKRNWRATNQAVAKYTQNGDEQVMLHPAPCLPTGQEAHRVLQRASSEQREQIMYVGSFKNDCRESPQLLFRALWGFFYLPITKLHDFFASLIKQLIDAGAL